MAADGAPRITSTKEQTMPKKHTTAAIAADPRTALVSQRDELLARLNNRYELTAERYADPIDQSLEKSERENYAIVISADTALLRQVSAALARLKAGCYGICDGCGDPISPARLAALPWAALCVVCQEAAEMAGVEA